MAITVKEAQTLFVSYFGRPADFEGLKYWTGTETLVGSLEQLAHSFFNSAEGKKYFPEDPATQQINIVESINAIYANMFGRVPETAGFDYWYNEIASGKINLAEAAVAIYKGAQGKDALMIENKIAAATQFTDQVAASGKPSLYYGDQAFAKANEFLNTVTDTTDVTSAGFAAQVNAAVNAAEAAGAVAGEGGTFMLTTVAGGILTNEVNVGFTPEGKYLTAGNDVVDLSKWDGSGSVNIGDAFSNDNDKVAVMASSLAGTNSNLKLTSIENLEIINAKETKALNLVGENFKGLESIKLKGDATTLNVSGFTYGVKIDATENADNIFGGTKADTINGGAGNDTIQGNQGNDVLTGGNGADTFIIGNAKDFGVDQILDFSAEDKISMDGFAVQELKKFDASTFSTVTYKTLDSVLATFATGGANATKAGDVVLFSYDGKTYALLANGAFNEATDALVDITGANVASLTESNFGTAPITPPTPTPGGDYNYENYTAFAADVALGVDVTNATIQTITVADAVTLNTTGSGNLSKIAANGIKAITGDVIDVNLSSVAGPHTVNAAAFDAKLDPSIIAAGTVTMNITGSGSADTLAASVLGGTIKGGNGIDAIKLNSGKDVVDFSTINLAANANNVIGFDVAKDKLQFDATTFTSLVAGSGVSIVNVASANDTATNKEIVVDTAAKIATLDQTTAVKRIAIATDTGDIIYDEDGNFTAGSVIIGNIGTAAASLTADNFVVA